MVERRHTLLCVCHQVSKQITFPDQLSTSHQQLYLFHLHATASLPTRCRIPYTLSDGTRTQFSLTQETTYGQYIMALRSRRVPHRQLLPPNFPHISLRFRCKSFSRKTHRHCPGPDVWWDVKMKRTFRSQFDAIRSLVLLNDLFWCTHCRKGLFFHTNLCSHPDVL